MSQNIACSAKKVLVSVNVVLITVLFWQLSKSLAAVNNWRLLCLRQVVSLLRLNVILAKGSSVGNSSWDGHALWVPTNLGGGGGEYACYSKTYAKVRLSLWLTN
jgi:hypothetical protein